MKTTITRTVEMIFQGAAILSLLAIFLFTSDVTAQHKEVLTDARSMASVPGNLQANIFPSTDPLMLKIVFVNPAKETVTLIVRNANREKVYTKDITNTEMYNSRLDVSGLPDGNYTFELQGKHQFFSQNFEILTQTARLTHVQ